jgi:hypothetical protein
MADVVVVVVVVDDVDGVGRRCLETHDDDDGDDESMRELGKDEEDEVAPAQSISIMSMLWVDDDMSRVLT